jgi:integrase
MIQGQVAKGGLSLEEVLSDFQPTWAKPNLVPTRLKAWLAMKRLEAEGGRLSPGYLRELESAAQPGGHFSFFKRTSIFDLNYAKLEDWLAWLAKRKLGPATQRNLLAYFRSFTKWLERREEIRKSPVFPTVQVPEYVPTIISLGDQERVLEAIPWERRGAFLAMAYLGIRPGEARAVRVSDVEGEWLVIRRAAKGSAASAPVKGTKTGRVKRLPIPAQLAEWITSQVDPRGRLTGALLFPNPTTGRMWGHEPLRRTWDRAARGVGVRVAMYPGTKHATGTALKAAGVDDRVLQRLFGHAGRRSTERYARLQDGALVTALRTRLSLACPWPPEGESEKMKK